MRPIRLEMTAFGPYKDVESIDFRELGDRNLFLVTGPTGAGKTTIFDAISFAIYGESSGNTRSAESLRSHFAEDELLTEVTLEFELKGVRYKVHRIPRQNKPKARGEGFTEQKADATLTIFNPDTTDVVITGVKNVSDKLESVLGINAEQFKQIMMIPQGEFQKMLTSGSEERQRVLQKLFDTRIYNDFQNRLELQAKNLLNEIKRQRDIRNHEIGKIACEGNDMLKQLIAAEDKAIDEIRTLTMTQLTDDRFKLTEQRSELERINNAIEITVSEREKAKEMNAAIAEYDSMVLHANGLEAQQGEYLILESGVKRGEQALLVTPILKNLQRRIKDRSDKSMRLEALKKESAELDVELEKAAAVLSHETSESRQKERQEAAAEVSKLESMTEKVAKLGKVVTGIERLEKEVTILTDKRLTASSELELSKKSLEASNIRIDGIKAALVTMDKETLAMDRLKELLAELNRHALEFSAIDRLKVDQESLSADVMKFEADLSDQENKMKRMRLEHLLQQASKLATELQDGKPCPVCGSCDHPEPASAQGQLITDDMLQSEEKSVKTISDQLAVARRKTDKIEEVIHQSILKMKDIEKSIHEKIKRLTETGVIFPTVEALEVLSLDAMKSMVVELIEKQEDILMALDESAKLLQSLEKDHAEKVIQITSQEALITKLEDEINVIRLRLVEGRTMLQGIHDEVPEALRQEDLLKNALNYAKENQVILESAYGSAMKTHSDTKGRKDVAVSTLSNLMKDLAELAIEITSLETDLSLRMKQAGFEQLDEYEAAVMEEAEMAALKSRIEQYNRELHTAKEQMNRLKDRISSFVPVSLDVFDERLILLKEQQSQLTSIIGNLESAIATNKSIIDTMDRIATEIGDKEKLYSLVGHLSNVTKGGNTYRITFERYVLAAFLEDIIRAANVRLVKMTGGRYALSRTEELQRSNAKGGLELEVYDNYTGKSRHVRTLSGGESFKASLSMALGLADIVQAYAGGVQLDTMFIDEGFGTLDQESLDSAIDCLVDLQEAGRLVGIISHVQELKERIDSRLEVMSTSTGSRTRFTVG